MYVDVFTYLFYTNFNLFLNPPFRSRCTIWSLEIWFIVPWIFPVSFPLLLDCPLVPVRRNNSYKWHDLYNEELKFNHLYLPCDRLCSPNTWRNCRKISHNLLWSPAPLRDIWKNIATNLRFSNSSSQPNLKFLHHG